jgi:hypothetical protein
MVAYTGIPFYTMICKQDGHVQRAFTKTHASCEHEHEEVPETKKSCCQTESTCESTNEDDCCDFNADYLKIETPATIKTEQDDGIYTLLFATTQYFFLSYAALFDAVQADFERGSSHFPNKQCHRTFTGVFRI